MDKDEKLLVFLDSLGQDTDVDFARQMLEAHDWNIEAALNMVTGGDSAPSAAPATQDHGRDYVDEDGYRAPMRTGYTDTLMGPSPEEMIFEQAAAQAALGRDRGARAGGGFDAEADLAGADIGDGRAGRDRRGDTTRQAMMASQMEYERLNDHQEQSSIASAIQASYADFNVAEQQRLQQSMQNQSEEQRLIAQAIEASFREQTGADSQYRDLLDQALAASQVQDTATAFPSGQGRASSGRTSPVGTAVHSLVGGRGPASVATRASPNAAARDLGSGPGNAAAASSQRSNRFSPVSQPSSEAVLRQARPTSGEGLLGQPRHAAQVRANAGAISSAAPVRQPRLNRGSSGSDVTGQVPAALAVNGSLSGPQRPIPSGRADDHLPGSRVSSGRGVGEPLVARSGVAVARNVGIGSSIASTAARAERRDPGAASGPSSSLGGAGGLGVARGLGVAAHRPTSPNIPFPAAPPPPATGSRSINTPPPNMVARHGAEGHDYVPKAVREPRNGLAPLTASRAPGAGPGQEAAMRGLREAAESDRRRYPPEEEERQKREADLRKLEATREAEEQRQRREAEGQEIEERTRQAEAKRRKREQEVATADRQRRAAAEAEVAAASAEAEQRRRRDEEQRKRREDEEQRRQGEAEERVRRKGEEAESRRRAETDAVAEAERKKREAEEFETQRQAAEVENRRREAKEAEELERERRDAEQRKREVAEPAAPEKEKEGNEVVIALVALRKKYKEDPEGLATCLKTLGTYLRNLANNPSEQKYQRINTENNAFQKRVAPFQGSIAVLAACGFNEDGATLVVGAEFLKSKGPRLFDACTKIDVMVGQLQK